MSEAKVYSMKNLGYEYDALAPLMSAETLEIHYDKLLRKYVDNLNGLIAQYGLSNVPENIQEFVAGLRYIALDAENRNRIVFNAGGVANHRFFFDILKKNKDAAPDGNLLVAINANFGSFEKFQEAFELACSQHMGNGWAWLAVDPSAEKITVGDVTVPAMFITTTSNHDSPLMMGIVKNYGLPILCLDLWEHAYFLQYKNRRDEYIKAFWSLINWEKVAKNLEEASVPRF